MSKILECPALGFEAALTPTESARKLCSAKFNLTLSPCHPSTLPRFICMRFLCSIYNMTHDSKGFLLFSFSPVSFPPTRVLLVAKSLGIALILLWRLLFPGLAKPYIATYIHPWLSHEINKRMYKKSSRKGRGRKHAITELLGGSPRVLIVRGWTPASRVILVCYTLLERVKWKG